MSFFIVVTPIGGFELEDMAELVAQHLRGYIASATYVVSDRPGGEQHPLELFVEVEESDR